jgi:hypothetical protein
MKINESSLHKINDDCQGELLKPCIMTLISKIKREKFDASNIAVQKLASYSSYKYFGAKGLV